jgi:rod shape-determining protein MreD
MSLDLFKRLGLFIIMCAVQILILNHIHLFDVATPFLFVYFAISFRRGTPKWAILLWSFFLGLFIDIFANTPGVAAASLTFIATIQPYFVQLFLPRDSADNLKPSLTTLGPSKYSIYMITLVLLYCILFYSLEFFNFFNWLQWAMCIVGSTVITVLLIYSFEIFKNKQ